MSLIGNSCGAAGQRLAATIGVCVVSLIPSTMAWARHTPAPTTVIEAPVGPLEPAADPQVPGDSRKDLFSFAVLGDSAPPAADIPVPSVLYDIFNDIGIIKPDLVFHTGNFAVIQPDPSGGSVAVQAQIDQFRSISALLGIPMFIAPGSKDIPDVDADSAFRHAISGGRSWRSFDYGNSHFVVLSTEEPGARGSIAGEQMTWLKDDLANHDKAAHTFVFLNRTAFLSKAVDVPNQGFASDADRDGFTALMAQNHVTSVFSGGQPLYSRTEQNGVTYINTGGGGSATAASPAEGGFTHYVLVNVDADKVTIVPLQPGRIDERADYELGVMMVYNLSGVNLKVGSVGVLVPAKWRTKRSKLIGAERYGVYRLDAKTLGPGSANVDAAVVGIKEADVRDPLRNSIDVVYVKTAVPAGSVVKITLTEADPSDTK